MKKNLTAYFVAATMVVGSFTVLTGCWEAVSAAAGVAAGVGVTAYVEGSVTETMNGSLAQVSKATEAAVADLKFSTSETNSDGTSYTVVCRNAEDDKVTIELSYVTDTVTKVKIRVGIFGDEAKSMAILNSIKNHLGISTSA
jgi:hypothetical protein